MKIKNTNETQIPTEMEIRNIFAQISYCEYKQKQIPKGCTRYKTTIKNLEGELLSIAKLNKENNSVFKSFKPGDQVLLKNTPEGVVAEKITPNPQEKKQ